MKQPKLFHLTCEPWWILIAQTGVVLSRLGKEERGLALSTGSTVSDAIGGKIESVHYPRIHADDIVIDGLVWLTQNPMSNQRWQEPVAGVNGKGGILIEVEAPEVVRWEPFMRRHDPPMDMDYMRALNDSGGKGQSALWWVTPGPIPEERWVKVTRTRDGLVLYERGDA